MIDAVFPDVIPTYGSVHSVLKRFAEQKKLLGAVFLDYCSTFLGNEACCPRDDIELLFSVLASRAVVAMTFCLRNGRGVDKADIRRFFETTAKKAGRKLVMRDSFSYHPSMYFIVYVIGTDSPVV